uniref:lytic transglycosylase domain-containing protein n=1 Tax=Pseudomonas syringae TaxID=317 RepID=UPI001E4221E0|nr:lytic transglycosylase domain-containing protein [Pseudomonas syringae]QOQ33321.1 Peptidoglycan hydrolase VirB1, involved in T-DNA transfer [Pseudomonas syringae pv. actinidiae]
MQKLPKFTLAIIASACLVGHVAAEESQPKRFSELAAKCAPKVHASTLKAFVDDESSFNPYAIGVVGTRLERQPKSLSEAVATAEQLERDGYRYSMGLGQLLVTNMRARGMSYQDVFEPCRNLQAISNLLIEYYSRALKTSTTKQEALLKATSMYYSGNELRGFEADRPGEMSYVEKVVERAMNPTAEDPIVPAFDVQEAAQAIPVVASTKSPAKARKRAQGASEQPAGPWLTFTDGNGQAIAQAQPQAQQKPQIQVQLDTGDAPDEKRNFTAFDAPTANGEPAAVPVQQEQAAPSFVQIIN